MPTDKTDRQTFALATIFGKLRGCFEQNVKIFTFLKGFFLLDLLIRRRDTLFDHCVQAALPLHADLTQLQLVLHQLGQMQPLSDQGNLKRNFRFFRPR